MGLWFILCTAEVIYDRSILFGFGCFGGFCSFCSFGSFNCYGSIVLAVDALDCGAFETDTGSVSGGFENKGVVLYVDNSADDTADGGNFIADSKAVSHSGCFLFLLSLGTDHEEVHDNEEKREDQEGKPAASAIAGGVRASFKKHGIQIEHEKISFPDELIIIYVSISHN